MVQIKIETIVDRYNTKKVIKHFLLNCQMLRFNKNHKLIATLGHRKLLKLRNEIDLFIKENQIDGKPTRK